MVRVDAGVAGAGAGLRTFERALLALAVLAGLLFALDVDGVLAPCIGAPADDDQGGEGLEATAVPDFGHGLFLVPACGGAGPTGYCGPMLNTQFRRIAAMAALCAVAGCAAAPPPKGPLGPGERESALAAVAHVLDDWHDAAARADEERYFGHFAPGGVFLGTDATERWELDAFRAYAHPHFAKGKAWSFRAHDRHIALHDGVAYFDEALSTPNLGPARGSGVLLHDKGQWKIAQYNLSVPIPNERFKEVKALLEGAPGK